MFSCSKCGVLESEVKFLRAELGKVTDRLVALASPSAYQAVSFTPPNGDDFYGSDKDEQVSYDHMGRKVIMVKS